MIMKDSVSKQFDQQLLDLGLTRTVYSFYYPETQMIVDRLWQDRPHFLYHKSYLQPQAELHHEFARQWLQWVSPVVKINTHELKYFYPCMGSSEAIREAIAQIKVKNGRIHVFEGEYEGYNAVAQAYEVPVLVHPREQYQTSLNDVREGDTFFLSEPSSLDGNYWTGIHTFIPWLEKNHPQIRLTLDLCYIGTTLSNGGEPWKLESPLISTVFFSLSKVFGVYYHRIGGVFHREPAPSLVGNEYFRNLFSLHLGIELLKNSTVSSLPEKYKDRQRALVESLQPVLPGLRPADCVLLASQRPAEQSLSPLQEYLKRKRHLRVCLTPGFDRLTEAQTLPGRAR